MAKRLSDKEKKVIVELFEKGTTIDALSKEFKCTKSTISRNLKKTLGDEKYKDFVHQYKKNNNNINEEDKNNFLNENNDLDKIINYENTSNNLKEQYAPISEFTEIIPLNHEIDNAIQKDLSSISISDFTFPKTVYMIVDKKIELEIKYLKEYPDWQFLSQEELDRKTIEIYVDLKIAKRNCMKEQKVIKVPNTDVFKIVAPLLLNKGISRIVSSENLIAL